MAKWHPPMKRSLAGKVADAFAPKAKRQAPTAQTRIATQTPKKYDTAGMDPEMVKTLRGEAKRQQAVRGIVGKARKK